MKNMHTKGCYVLFVLLLTQECLALISLDQVGHCKSSLYEQRIKNFNLKSLNGELTTVYISANYQPSVSCFKQTFSSTESSDVFSLTSLIQNNGQQSSLTETSRVVSNSDGSYTITEYVPENEQSK
uniref:GOLD domain-containing protein n=1 Tax=Clastoptera arizonana TaxID=38151 RepID=A0A1B6D6Y5_9HEMI